MPNIGFASPNSLRHRALVAVGEIASGSGREIEAAALVVSAARASALAGEAGRGAVAEIAARWDPRALTATEFAEQLPVRELAALLAGAPGWARSCGNGWRAAA